jgi:DAK2 domain fusion protein YloV
VNAVADVLDADAVRRWCRSAVDSLEAHRAEIDALNVFPVPDGDTGRNMLLTMRAAHSMLDGSSTGKGGGASPTGDRDPGSPAAALAALSTGAADGAIGNSGFLLSQILRGLADAAADAQSCDAATVAEGLLLGVQLAREAVVTPVDGTMLTVARAAADAARAAVAGEPVEDPAGALAGTLLAAVVAGDAALQRTPDQLPELAEAGVVDAGGRGLVLVLNALATAVSGRVAELTAVRLPIRRSRPGEPAPEGTRQQPPEDDILSYDGPQYEVQYHLEADPEAVQRLRTELAELGESVAVVSTGRDAWRVHVHVNDVGAAVEAALGAGRPHGITVADLGARSGSGPAAPAAGTADPSARLVIALASGRGMARLFEREGVRVLDAGPREPVAAAAVAAAVPPTVREVVVLAPADGGVEVADEAAAILRGRRVQVSVVPVRSSMQGLAAVAVHDAGRRFDDDIVAMAEAAAATRFAEVIVAASAGLTAVGLCQPGDVLGLIDGEIVVIGHGLLAVAFDVLDRLLAVGAELITVVAGAGAGPRDGELVAQQVRRRAPLTEVIRYDGGDSEIPIQIGAE